MNEVKYKVVLSDVARSMLGSHIKFIAQVNKEATMQKKNEIMKALRTLEYMPERYPYLHGNYIPHNKYRKLPIQKYYLVIYQIREMTVFVDSILDTRKDYEWLRD